MTAPFAPTPRPPYTAVVFTSVLRDDDGYAEAAARMDQLAARQPGYLGIEWARRADGTGITVSYWRDDDAARAWKAVAEHRVIQEQGRARWYAGYRVRIATVQRDYGSDDPITAAPVSPSP